MRSLFLVAVLLAAVLSTHAAHAQPFVHPGLLQSRADLDRMRDGVKAGTEPIKSGYAAFNASPQSRADYVPRGPFAHVGRNPTIRQGEFDSDANAAYQCAIQWAITGDPKFAEKSRVILDGYSTTLTEISGADAILMAGLGPFKMINAAEILRYTDPKWTVTESQQCERLFRAVVYPVLQNFAPFANGNWDTAAIKTMLAIAVFCDDRRLFERALDYYVDGAGDGRLTHYIYPSGECQESGRDQQHTQLGLAHLGDCCEIAWNQGLDLYAYADNRLLVGFEYTAKYNLGEDVVYMPDIDRTGNYSHKVISARGALRPVYEQIYNHYVNRRGLSAPNTTRAAERVRPEGAAQGADHPGFGTLLYSRAPAEPERSRLLAPSAPGGLVARGTLLGIALSWVASIKAVSYDIQRCASSGGAFETVTSGVGETTYKDNTAVPGKLYQYLVVARNSAGRGRESLPTTACAGLPAGWLDADIGDTGRPGSALFDGTTFTIEAGGSRPADAASESADGGHFVFHSLSADSTLTARFVPQFSSQFTRFGLAIRASASANAAAVTLTVGPERDRNLSITTWNARVTNHAPAGPPGGTIAEPNAAPLRLTADYARLTIPYWLRLARSGDTVTGLISEDGKTWTAVGSARLPADSNLKIGLFANSGVPTITTTVRFDHVTVERP